MKWADQITEAEAASELSAEHIFFPEKNTHELYHVHREIQ
jgi:hypothetical protein